MFSIKENTENAFRNYSSSYPLFPKIFSIIQKSFMKNIFRKTFHTLQPILEFVFGTHFQDSNIATTLFIHSIPFI